MRGTATPQLVSQRQRELPIVYKGVSLEGGFRIDIVVEEMVIIEVKAVEKLLPVHEAQLLTYLKLAELKLGLLMNFTSTVVSHSIRQL
jgi:GxxExxY protein